LSFFAHCIQTRQVLTGTLLSFTLIFGSIHSGRMIRYKSFMPGSRTSQYAIPCITRSTLDHRTNQPPSTSMPLFEQCCTESPSNKNLQDYRLLWGSQGNLYLAEIGLSSELRGFDRNTLNEKGSLAISSRNISNHPHSFSKRGCPSHPSPEQFDPPCSSRTFDIKRAQDAKGSEW
jgi:hypothetical protein